SALEVAAACRAALEWPRRLRRTVRRRRALLSAAAGLLLAAGVFAGLALSPREPSPGEELRRGLEAHAAGRHAEASELLTGVLTRDGDSAAVRLARGRARLELGDAEGALLDLRKADSLAAHGQIKATLAYVYVGPHMVRHPEAIGHYREAIRLGFDT